MTSSACSAREPDSYPVFEPICSPITAWVSANEVGVANITVYNDANNNSKLDSGEKTTTTDGWTITLATNQVLSGKDFGTRQTTVTPPPTGASISGTVFNDLAGDRVNG
jgi:hypothetical protein